MKNIFEKTQELNSAVTKMMGRMDIVNIEVNATMTTLAETNGKISDAFLADRYLELVERLVEAGIVVPEWES